MTTAICTARSPGPRGRQHPAYANFAGFTLDLASVPGSQVFAIPVQQRGLVQVLADRASEYDADIRTGHALNCFDQDEDGITVHVAGPEGTYDLRAKYLVGADGGTSKVRHLADIRVSRDVDALTST